MSYWKKVVLGIMLISFGLVGVVFWSVLEQYHDLLSRMSISDDEPPQEKARVIDKEYLQETPPLQHQQYQREEKVADQLKPFILLLYGMDKREQQYDRGRPDTLMLALFNPNVHHIQLISLPRDAYVPIPGHGQHKLNHSFSKGGANLTIKTIEQWLDIKLKGYVAIDFAGFVKLIDLLGGIPIDVDRDMNYDDPEDGTAIHLKQGEQILNGEQALQFVRFRYSNHGPADSDYKRMERQQEVLKQIAKKITGIPTLIKLLAIKRVMEEHIQTTLTPSEINRLIYWLIKAEHPQIEGTSMVGQGKYERRLWFEVIPEEEKKRIQHLINEFLEG